MKYFRSVFLGVVCVFAFALARLWAQSSAPQAYSLSEVTYMTEVSMFTGQASNLKVYRSGSKELVELTIPPWAAEPKGVHQRYLFDFQAHKAYIQDFTHNACSWKNYISARAPINYDPVTGGDMTPAQLAEAKQHAVGTESVNGIPAWITESNTKDSKFRMWIAQKGDFVVKLAIPGDDGKFNTWLEVKQVDFSPPAAALFVPPANCSTQAQGDWSDTTMNAHAEANITVQGSGSANLATGETHGQVKATVRQGSAAGASQSAGAGTGSNAEDFVDTSSLLVPSENTCTVLFRAVRAGTMEPITSGLDVSLDGRDVTGQYRDGVLRISNAPPKFSLQVQVKNGAARAAQVSRACFRPETVLLLVVSPDFITQPDKWLWVKSGKYATVPAPVARGTAAPAGRPGAQPPQASAGVTAVRAGASRMGATSPQGTSRVTGVRLHLVPDHYEGPCPGKVQLVAEITTNGPGTVWYQFLAGAVSRSPEGTVSFDAAGTQAVTIDGSFRLTPRVPHASVIAIMQDEAGKHGPLTVSSGPVNYNITCTGQ